MEGVGWFSRGGLVEQVQGSEVQVWGIKVEKVKREFLYYCDLFLPSGIGTLD